MCVENCVLCCINYTQHRVPSNHYNSSVNVCCAYVYKNKKEVGEIEPSCLLGRKKKLRT